MKEGWSLVAVGGSAGILHFVGHTGWSAGKHTDLGQIFILLLQVVKEGVEVGTTKVSYRAQASEQAATGKLLEVPLTDVLWNERQDQDAYIQV